MWSVRGMRYVFAPHRGAMCTVVRERGHGPRRTQKNESHGIGGLEKLTTRAFGETFSLDTVLYCCMWEMENRKPKAPWRPIGADIDHVLPARTCTRRGRGVVYSLSGYCMLPEHLAVQYVVSSPCSALRHCSCLLSMCSCHLLLSRPSLGYFMTNIIAPPHGGYIHIYILFLGSHRWGAT